MNRRPFPEFGMSAAESADLRGQGVVVIPFMESVAQDPSRMRPHYHEFFQIFLLQGRAAVMHDFVEFEARGTTLVFLSPGQVHAARPAPGMRGTTLSFTQTFFDHHAPPPSALFDFPFFFPAEARPWLVLSPEEALPIAAAFAELQREFDAAQSGAAEILRATLHILLIRANRLYAEANPPREITRATQLLRQFHLAVEQHFREFASVAQYARLLGVTANHLHDTVREQTGHAAGLFIRRRRLLDARRLLAHSDLSISEIGYQLGFRDPSYFSRFFRREDGQTPAEFQQGFREKYQRKAG